MAGRTRRSTRNLRDGTGGRTAWISVGRRTSAATGSGSESNWTEVSGAGIPRSG
jgi:hypothetical protein